MAQNTIKLLPQAKQVTVTAAAGVTGFVYTALKFGNIVIINASWEGSIQGVLTPIATIASDGVPTKSGFGGSGMLKDSNDNIYYGNYRIAKDTGAITQGVGNSPTFTSGAFSFAYVVD